MKTYKSWWKINSQWMMALILLNACVERIEFDVPPAESQTVIEGMISDSPGPYTVKITKSLNLNALSSVATPIENATIKLYDDQGDVEDFVETSPGIYGTGGVIQGEVGHSYHILVETPDGRIFESEPDMLNPVGEVEEIRFEFEARATENGNGTEITPDVFNIYVDAHAGAGNEIYVRWRFTGTYKAVSQPELREIQYTSSILPLKDPLPCSGYIVIVGGATGMLEKVDDCTCCTCWANHFESAPQISDGQFISDNQFKNVKVAEVPINTATFYDKYLVEVEQMSLSRKAFEFFDLIRAQKEGASSLFQPPSGEIKGNITPMNAIDPVIGLFWATSVNKKSIFIHRSDVPYALTPITFVPDACTAFYPDSFSEKPEEWE